MELARYLSDHVKCDNNRPIQLFPKNLLTRISYAIGVHLLTVPGHVLPSSMIYERTQKVDSISCIHRVYGFTDS